MSERIRPTSGRRPGSPETQAEILSAAREAFAVAGYEGASIRKIATRAGVDPALVLHYFGSKEQLFGAAIALPIDPEELGARVFGAGIEGAGERLATMFLGLWEDPATAQQVRALFRAVVGQEEAAQTFRAALQAALAQILPPAGLAPGTGALRFELAASHLLGVAVARYFLAIPPIATVPLAELVPILGTVLQRYLDGDSPQLEGEPDARN